MTIRECFRKAMLSVERSAWFRRPFVATVEIAIMNQVIMNQFDSESILASTELGTTKKTVCDVEYMW